MNYPRVTEILYPFSNYDKIPENILLNAAKRGENVHSLCEGIVKGAWLIDEMIDDEYKGYVNSFRQWKDAQMKECLIVEERYNDDKLGITGKPDLVIIAKDNNKYLVDIKTTYKPKISHKVQMAAYEYLLRCQSIHVYGAMILYLNKNGEFPDIHPIYDFTKEFSVFLSALECWKYFKEEKNERT